MVDSTTQEAAPEVSNEDLLKQFEQLAEYHVIDYILPTVPLGEAWVVGKGISLLKLNTQEEAMSFLMGANMVLTWLRDNHLPHPQ